METKINNIELMFFEGCPSWKEAHQHLVDILKSQGINIEIILRNIETNKEAVKYQFPGSPTIKVNGNDIFPTNQTNYSLSCRVYETSQGFKGSPTTDMINKKLLEFT